ncbi:serine/threonine-protein kinase [Streptomyces sp. Ru71]|uniref:serine/threonine-protein kinase n=1 Tax=Streptomyces sp. Ru71 TaxID=2080746 RepID=UPI0021566A40|nr:serine/threonine-protein kinase [Streptomyces sp. Ru71]
MRDQLLGGRYRLVEPLGEGGMGQVWEARDERLDRHVAVKLISLLSGGGSHATDARARFLREARLTARLQHPRIVTLHDVGEANVEGRATPFLVMERLRGQGLDALLRRGGITPGDAARWGSQVADALAEAHAAGVMHRDVKPSNIMVTGSGDVKVLDFGIARAADPYATTDRLTQTGFIVGTPPYMAPEQARGRPEPRSDLYALGCVLFELLTGRLPFEAPDTLGYLSAHLTDTPPAPGSLAPGLSADWDALVLRLLEKDPGSRHDSAAQVAAALRRLDRPEPTTGQSDRPEMTTRQLDQGRPEPTAATTASTERIDVAPPTLPVTSHGPGETGLDARRSATVAMAAALTCLPPLVYMISLSVTYLTDPGAPIGLLVGNLLLGLAESAALGLGVGLLLRRRLPGRRTIAVAGVATALHGLSAALQYEVADGPQTVVMIAHVVGPLTAVAAVTAVVAALRPSTARWCRGPQAVPEPVVRAGTVAPALLTLFAAAGVPFSAGQAVDAGMATYASGVLQTVLFLLLTAVLAIGAVLVLVRNPVGRMPVIAGGLGFALVALNSLLHANALGYAFRILLFLMAVTAVITTVRAALPPGRARRRPST